MNSLEALKQICLDCERAKAKNKVLCPFRSISSDYCEKYETIEKDLELLEELMNHICIDGEDECHQYITLDRMISNDDIDTEEIFYRIKEWLEND